MRKAQREQVQECISLLQKAHELIRTSIHENQTSVANGLLEECQDAAIAIGTAVEKSEGLETKSVKLLEEYCELTYSVHESMVAGEHLPAGNTFGKLRKLMEQIDQSIEDEVKVRKEAVFLPYKASMWDSLESVWMKLDADDDYDAYVVPIPYYDKNPDGSFGEFHYEVDQYPENVPVLDYKSYDFEERRPDEVYIHSPYDECNYVTSVEPFYYSKNLKKYTDKLVYIPYFVLSEPDPENEVALEGMAHFVTVPAVIYADQVIVQSEAMKKAYVKIMTKYMQEQGLTREYWENKILGTGSPKFDKLARLAGNSKEEIEIPKEWRPIIEKPDGSRKKVILYNTTVSAILENTDIYIRKMRDVFQIFKENKDDVALLWRPHPLIQATISSMRPQLWEEYQEVKEEYLKEGWGIYDDSAELDRAIGLSDAYYGDWSSVVQLCQSVKMPVMIQNCNV